MASRTKAEPFAGLTGLLHLCPDLYPELQNPAHLSTLSWGCLELPRTEFWTTPLKPALPAQLGNELAYPEFGPS